MKKILLLLFIVSITINVFFIAAHIIGEHKTKELHNLYDIKQISYKEGLKSLFEKLREDLPNLLKDKKFLFIQTFDTITTRSSRLIYTRHIDSVFAGSEYSNMDKLLVSEMPGNEIETFKKNHQIEFKSFKLLPDADDFISGVFVLKKARAKSHPIQLIINREGDILYYNGHVSGLESKDSTLYNTLQIIKP